MEAVEVKMNGRTKTQRDIKRTLFLELVPCVYRDQERKGSQAATVPARGAPPPGSNQRQAAAPLEVQMCQSILPCHADHQGLLSAGQLLKWMDTTACLAAERHAGISCVTVSMDDIQFEEAVRVGQVIIIKARCNRAFTTSMEVGIRVSVEDVLTGVQRTVCVGFSTFVGKPVGSQKVILRPVENLCSEEEQLQHSLASERRRLRLYNDEAFSSLLRDYQILQRSNLNLHGSNGLGLRKDTPSLTTENTRVESTELVLPPHANHHGNTFGGQIMAWMENTATVAACRLWGCYPTLRSVDMFRFRGPSSVGDRLVFKALVNNIFQNSVEVGVRVEAYNCQEWTEGKPRHINSAFLIYQQASTPDDAPASPTATFTTQDGERRYLAAIVRKRIRMARKHILSCKEEGPLSVPWTKSNQVYLGYNNVAALTVLAGKQDWEASSLHDRISVYVHEETELLCLRVEMEVTTSALHAFTSLADPCLRPQWDRHYLSCKEVERADEEEVVYHITCSPNDGDRIQDFVILLSKRQPCKDGDPYVIAERSVTVTTVPPREGFRCGEIQCVGFLIHTLGPNSCRVCYYSQVTSSMLPYVAGDLAGWSKSMEETAHACIGFLERDVFTTIL
ncbi:acetyl-coenzyme A thioesterase [Osmerus eperlanus]|uniref:acetyl-coenzyme A thioesterase n=1 Tax=Osmerus eperlanus TaxID=29151 RepID=UPI002E13ABCD